MSYRTFLAGCLLASVAMAQAGDPPGGKTDNPAQKGTPSRAAAFVHRLWVITDVVLDKHIEPPTRQEMFLAAARALFTKEPAPADLGRRVSRLTTEAEFAALFEELWPREGDPADEQREEIVQAALLRSVPGHPHVMPPKDAKAIKDGAANRYVGIGVQIGFNAKEKCVAIVIPLVGGAARKAGARPGDLIVEVDGVNTEGMALRPVLDRLRGDENTRVSVVVRQPGEKETRTLKMVRAVVPFETAVGYRRASEEAWSYRIEADVPIAYVRIESLATSTPSELRKVEARLHGNDVRAVVIDLRGTGGGQLHEAALVADELLDGGLMWRVRDGQNRVREYRADRDCLFRGWPMAVLVDEHTLSLGDLVAGALRDNRKAVVVGERPSGEGWVTSFVDLPGDLGTMVLRTGRVEPADGAAKADEDAPRRWRLKLDHEVKIDMKQRGAIYDWHRAQHSPEPNPEAKPPEDPQLAKALSLLKEALKKPAEGDGK
jgi:carboxyl-terminal processing protease